ncbi:MAG: hypothetical protein KBG12_09910 [Syntrophobacterales bacterium]|nr:hypothetical protein [Syntrophobacterales bacterium]
MSRLVGFTQVGMEIVAPMIIGAIPFNIIYQSAKRQLTGVGTGEVYERLGKECRMSEV